MTAAIGSITTAPPRVRQRLVDLYVLAVVAVASATLGVLAVNDRTPFLGESSGLVFCVFAALLILGEIKPMKWLRLDDGGELTMSWAFAFCLILLGSVSGAVVMMATASAIGDLVRRKPLRRLLFNASQLALSITAAAAVLSITGNRLTLAADRAIGPWWIVSLVLAASTAFLLNGFLTCVALALHEGTSIVAMLRRGLLPNLSTDGALLALAPCFLVIADRSLLLLPLVLVTASFVYRSTRAALLSEHAASHDVLTELLNRRAFDQRVEQWLDETSSSHERGAIALIDLDGFKQINDQLGHHIGDLVLQEVGRRLIAERQPGQIAARLGGDEFAVLFTTVHNADDALDRARQLHRLISQEVTSAGFPIAVGGSVGISLVEPSDDRETAMQHADLAMYLAKRSRSEVELYCEPTNGREGRDRGRLALLSDLEGAIARDELLLHYQPQFDLMSGDLTGVEALLRWNHPVLGMVAPGEFMPLAEHTELMGPITDYVLHAALSTYSSWQHLGVPLRVAVNASAQNLQDLRFPDSVQRILDATGAPAEALEIEITENTVMSSPERTRVVLAQLKAQGVRIALDDFGTGYSSLTNLRDLPIHAIKIDRSFVRSLADDADDREIVRSLIELAHTLRLEVTAEGVEDDHALAVLESFGCDTAQGYLLGRPMPEADLMALIRRPSEQRRCPTTASRVVRLKVAS